MDNLGLLYILVDNLAEHQYKMVNMNMMGYFPKLYIENSDHTAKGHKEVSVDRFEVEELVLKMFMNKYNLCWTINK